MTGFADLVPHASIRGQRAAATAAADEEIAFIADLCAQKPVNTVFTVYRRLDEDGNIREEFREITPPGETRHARVWDVEDTHG